MRTPAELADQINSLNCHVLPKSRVVKDGVEYDPSEIGYGPLTPTQVEAIYAEARKMEWTDRKPDRPGWWWYRSTLRSGKTGKTMPMQLRVCGNSLRWGMCDIHGIFGQWSTRPIDMPE